MLSLESLPANCFAIETPNQRKAESSAHPTILWGEENGVFTRETINPRNKGKATLRQGRMKKTARIVGKAPLERLEELAARLLEREASETPLTDPSEEGMYVDDAPRPYIPRVANLSIGAMREANIARRESSDNR